MSKGRAVAVLLGAAVLVVASGAAASPTVNGDGNGTRPVPPPDLSQNETRALLYSYAQILEQALGWYALADFLDATAYTESRWHLRPRDHVPKSGRNRATGPYQIRPNSAGDTDELREIFLDQPWLLEDPRIATAAVVAGGGLLVGHAVEARVQAVPRQQLAVGAALHDASLVQHHHPVGPADGGQPVGDDEGRLALHQVEQVFLNRHFDFRIQRAGRFVEDQDRRVLEQH
ncbi:hypothetical protein LCGC14_3144820, partial [marine sediment metagenome]